MTQLARAQGGARRMRRLRRRREKGIVAVIPVELYDYEVERLMSFGFLSSQQRADRKAIKKAIYAFLDRRL
jgi:hypothetical protein